jgi:hypothetical protein
MFGDFRLEPCLDAEASRVARYSIPAALLRLTFGAAADGLTDPGAHCPTPQTGQACRGRDFFGSIGRSPWRRLVSMQSS